jgi:organic hydroperoxide reductase OsmC/OhrA
VAAAVARGEPRYETGRYGAQVAATEKRFEYAIAVDRAGRLSAEGGASLELDDAWTADHMLLAALARCTLTSLRYHAQRANIEVSAGATASGAVAKRDEDGRYAFVEIECRIDAALEPEPAAEELTGLLANAERDCFVGASLTVAPRYRWQVNGSQL